MNRLGSVSTTTTAGISKKLAIDIERLSQYSICATVGVLSGAAGVALMTAIAIVIHSLLFDIIFAPGVTPLIIASTLVGLGIARLLGQALDGILPGLGNNKLAVQMILVFSVFTTLLLPLLFEYRLILISN